MNSTPLKKKSETPLMTQYNQIKAKHPEALLLFRVGDFYETFGEDAVITSKVLGIILTKRGAGSSSETELAGFPHHSLDNYLPKLVRAGYRVAICDQLEDPKMTKTIVKRGVTELVTPGVAFNDQVLDQNKNNFLCSLYFSKNDCGIAFLDVSTGEFLVAQGTSEYIEKLLQSFEPSEVVFQKNRNKEFEALCQNRYHSFKMEDWVFGTDYAQEILNNHFQTQSLKGFGIEGLPSGIIAAGAALHYIKENQHNNLNHIATISRIEEEKYVWLDRFTIRNLELVYSQNENAITLSHILDKTLTPMGGRLMKRWIVLPLKEERPINERLDAVSFFKNNAEITDELVRILKQFGDLERLISKVAVAKVNPKEVQILKRTLAQIPMILEQLNTTDSIALRKIADQLNPCFQLVDEIEKTILEDPAIQIGKGMVIAKGINEELDQLRALSSNGKEYLEQMQIREAEKSGIPSLKIAYNNVFGYYLEVRNTHKEKVPSEWIRKQTLVNAERYITEELKEYEQKILGAEEKILILEQKLFQNLILAMLDYIQPIQHNAVLLAQLDCLLSFAIVAFENDYTLPRINDGYAIEIKQGRHPVIEKLMKAGETYVANDIFLDREEQQIIMITGPNMSGKSAILRQTALICLMAQMGSFVPAQGANIGLLDKVFTRVGASDNISTGESTFMVEMNETASILNNLSERSLILLDEIGRGTSTYDGISIAWAIAEFIHEHPKLKAKTLFATHYHELNDMSQKFNRVHNFNVSVKEMGNKILFTRKLVPGGSAHSFGIHVAKLAGMPNQVLLRAQEMLHELEMMHQVENNSNKKQKKGKNESDNLQLSFFQLNDPVLENIREELVSIDINILTPVEALMKLHEIKKIIGG